NTTSQPAYCFHFLSLAELLLQTATLGYVFGEELEKNRLALIANGPPRETYHDRTTALANPVRDQFVEAMLRAEEIGEREPLRWLSIQIAQIVSYQIRT